VAIVGFGATAKDCPALDPSWELWAMNGFWRAAEPDYGIKVPEERYSLWFDMHTVEFTREYGKLAGFGDAQLEWLQREHPFPIFMLDEDPAFPSVRRYPIEAIVAKLGRDYFTSTIPYALAFALALDDVAEVGTWGIDLAHDSEYADQRPCAEYWMGHLEASGVKLTIHKDSALLKQRGRYGYELSNPLERELRGYLAAQSAGIQKVIQKNRAELERLQAQLHTDDGAVQMVHTMLERLDIWKRGGKV
jgi:hypothetical protein